MKLTHPLVLIWAPLSGKTSQGNILSQDLWVPFINAVEEVREIRRDPQTPQAVKDIINSGFASTKQQRLFPENHQSFIHILLEKRQLSPGDTLILEWVWRDLVSYDVIDDMFPGFYYLFLYVVQEEILRRSESVIHKEFEWQSFQARNKFFFDYTRRVIRAHKETDDRVIKINVHPKARPEDVHRAIMKKLKTLGIIQE